MCINIFTLIISFLGGVFDYTQPKQPQDRGLAPAWFPQSKTRCRNRRAICDQRIFRSMRPAAGQVRNRKTRAHRGTAHKPGLPEVRFLASNRVSSALCIRSGRISGAVATPARTAPCPQAQRGDRQFPGTYTGRRAWVENRGSGGYSVGSIRTISLPEQRRSGVASSEKKTSVTIPSSRPETDKQSLVTYYEHLRSLVLSGGIREVRDGLAVMLQKGMAAWMTVCSSCRQALTPTRSAPVEQVLPDEQYSQMVDLFANIALKRMKEVFI